MVIIGCGSTLLARSRFGNYSISNMKTSKERILLKYILHINIETESQRQDLQYMPLLVCGLSSRMRC
jgi:hypothetical protein